MQKRLTDSQKVLLDLCSKALFDKEISVFDKTDLTQIVDEAGKQTVFSMVCSALKELNLSDEFSNNRYLQRVAGNIQVCCAHKEIHYALTKKQIPYVVLKGVASAAYYNQPILRTMGDVDILVREEQLGKCDKVLESLGYVRENDIESDSLHIGYKKASGNSTIICELHRSVGVMPENMAESIDKYFDDIFEASALYTAQNSTCVVPDKFHHGLVLMLHTAAHLTSEGIGLRHLCDWAVFVNGLSNDEFVALFEKPLRKIGLWRFAQLLTICCVKYLGCDAKEWTGEADEQLIENIVCDIFDGGNFGYKNRDRYRQIKYIKNRANKTVDNKNSLQQLFCTINSKAKAKYNFANRCCVLLPIAWIAVLFDYFKLVFSGKREFDSISTVSEANSRKEIYSNFRLFEKE